MSSLSTSTERHAGWARAFRAMLALGMAIAFLLVPMWVARSQTVFERMVMPGPLIEGHAKLEKDCASCHEPFVRASQSKLCLTCHKDITADREQKRGFHGRRPDAVKGECRTCHTDHAGRTADIIRLDRQTFNHTFTNFRLEGSHTKARCESCHQVGKKFRAAASRCVDCHKASEPHKGRLGDKCEGCHSEQGWSRVKPFDHSKTKFPLVAAHAKVVCAACHVGERYKDLPTNCASCHAIQDAHAGKRGNKCETCHSPNAWRTVHFDHGKSTKFPLRGKHAAAKCEACHKTDATVSKPSTACAGCHQKDDPHKGQLGNRCGQCHNESGWREKIVFDHDVTRFPLAGLHATVPCEECHRSPSFKDAPRTCAACHKDTHHAGTLGSNCAQCHNPNGWVRWRFDHDKQTRYALTGAHRGLQCSACHKTRVADKPTASTTCFGCHATDDAHSGSFGRNCETCHGTTSFKEAGRRR